MREKLFKGLHAGIQEAIDKVNIYPAYDNRGRIVESINLTISEISPILDKYQRRVVVVKSEIRTLVGV